MSYPSDMNGLELFTAPFQSPQAVKTKAQASRPQQAKATAPLPKTVLQPVKPETSVSQPHPVKVNPPMEQHRQTNLLQNSALDKKAPALQKEQAKATEPKPGQKPQAEAPAKAQPEPPTKELSMDMSDRTIPAGKSLDELEDEAKRKIHEKNEAKRKAEWEAKQLAKKQARDAALEKIKSMNDADIVSASTERVRTDVEKLTRRNMEECVAEHIQSVCRKDPAFARQTMHPNKSMIRCFRYINRKAKDYIQQEMKDNDIKPENGIYGGDVPDDLVYQWSIDYFNDLNAQEDHAEEEKFTPRPYVSASSKAKGAAKPKKADKKETEKEKPKNGYQQMSLPGV